MTPAVDPRILAEIWDVICSRADHPTPDSYTSRLLTDKKGIDKVLEKVGEESCEFILAVKNGSPRADSRGDFRPALPYPRRPPGS